MLNRRTFLTLAILFALSAVISACSDSGADDDVRVTTPTASNGPEATYGAIERLPGGTAVITSPHTLVAITCDGTTVTMTTTVATFTGTMDCKAMPPAEIIARYTDKTIAITIGGGRLKIENPEAGSLDLPATEVTS